MQTQQPMKVTQEQCERAVEALQDKWFNASYVQGAPDDHGVWLDCVWDEELGDTRSFRIHDEEIEWWAAKIKD
jgi:hypothetical protein|tara:strand:- start:213 stop:431 length:219 start_codon:yes stop_codon:yes gene_type:complete